MSAARRSPRDRAAAAPTPRATATPAIPPVLWSIVLVALALRLWHLNEGLPEFFEEGFPFRRAFEMAGWESGRVDWNPHAFHYPSLSFYLHLLVQGLHYAAGRIGGWFKQPADFFVAFQVDPTPMVLVALSRGVLADLPTLVAVAKIGERLHRGAGWLAALLVALSATLMSQSRTIVTDGIMTAFATWSLERMLAYHARGRKTVLLTAAVLAGLAAGTKYPALLLVVPLVWAAWTRGGWRAAVLASAGAALVFSATSPFLFSSMAEVRFDLFRIASMVGEGQLGSFGRPTALLYLQIFVRDFGWLAPLPLLASLAWAWKRRGVWLGVWLGLLAFALPIALGHVAFERYLVAVLPFAALLVAATALTLPEAWSGLATRPGELVRAALVLAVGLPAAWAGFAAAARGSDTTQAQARRFLNARAGADELIVEEPYAAPLRARSEARRLTSGQAFARADPSWRDRYLGQPVARVVRLPLLVAGPEVIVAPDSAGHRREVRLFASSADLNRVFYEPALYTEVDWVVTSDAVRGRYEADPRRYRAQHALYARLDRLADSIATFHSGGTVTGPEIRAYQVGESFRRSIDAPLDPLWWTRDVPASARSKLEALMRGAEPPRSDLDAPPGWVLALGALLENQIESFTYALALEMADLGRCETALPLATAILRIDPGQVQA